jgi:phage-related protein
MDEVEKRVATKFEIDDGALGKLGALSTAFTGLGGLISRATSMINPLNVAIGALGGALSGQAIMKAGSEFEDLQIGLAQTLRFMGQGGNSFQDALHNSSIAMKQIIADAGPLPGNALDYANAMQVAGAVVQRATGDYQKSYDLIKATTAVAISIGGNAQLAAVELNRMLDAQKGQLHQYGDFNNKLLNAMRQLPGYAGLTVHEFNKFDMHKRLEIVTGAMAQFDDMVKASSSTWTAVKGAVEATSTLLVKSSTAPLFEGAKATLKGMNDAILQADGNFTALGQTIVNVGNVISSSIVGGLKGASHWALGVGAGLMQGGTEGATEAGGAAGQVGAVLGMATPALSGFIDYLTRAGQAAELLSAIGAVADTLVIPLTSLSEVATGVSGIMGDIFQNVLVSTIDALTNILSPLMTFWDGLAGIAAEIIGAVAPALSTLWEAVGNLVSSVGTFLNPVLSLLGAIGIGLASVFESVLVPVIKVVASAMGGLLNAIASLLKWLGNLLGKAFGDLGIALPAAKPGGISDAVAGFFAKFKDLGKGAGGGGMTMTGGGAAVPKPDAPMHRGGGGRAVQDFRYSRFEITQKFAEGFDPDRIAVAFAQDIGRIGEQRLQSGFEPTYAVR